MSEVLTPESPRWNEFVDALDQAGRAGGCHHDHRLAKRVMTEMGNIDIEESLVFFESRGGFCDCEILINVDPGFWGGAGKAMSKDELSEAAASAEAAGIEPVIGSKRIH